MAFFRKFFSFINKTPGCENEDVEGNSEMTIATYYLGHTFTAQPNSDELKRAAHILTAKSKKDLEKNQIPILYICSENASVLLRDGQNHKCREFEVRKIVMSCIDAKNQKLVAIFYHNDSPFIRDSQRDSTNLLECHLCLCKNKESAKTAANKIGELLSREYKIPSREPVVKKKIEDGSVRLSKANYEDFDYENVSKFFQQNVFGLPPKNYSVSSMSTPYSSLSTFATTNGCDSGCASTVASVDIRTDDSIIGIRGPTLNEHEELSSSFEAPADNIGSLDQELNRNQENCSSTTDKPIRDTSIYHNRYSVHYDQEDQDDDEPDDDDGDEAVYENENTSKKLLTSAENTDDRDRLFGMRTPELQRLLDIGETDIWYDLKFFDWLRFIYLFLKN